MARERKVRMEIVVQCDADPIVVPSPLQNLGVLRRVQADFGHVNRVHPALAKNGRRMGRESLVQQ